MLLVKNITPIPTKIFVNKKQAFNDDISPPFGADNDDGNDDNDTNDGIDGIDNGKDNDEPFFSEKISYFNILSILDSVLVLLLNIVSINDNTGDNYIDDEDDDPDMLSSIFFFFFYWI
jgi:hypothetical protein